MGFLGDIPVIPYCVPCAHYQYLYRNGGNKAPRACLYILDTGHMRPCPAGEGCAERVTPEEWRKTKLGAAQAARRKRGSIGGPNRTPPSAKKYVLKPPEGSDAKSHS